MNYSDSGSDNNEISTRGMCVISSALPFDMTSIENVILSISDSFDFRVVISHKRTKALIVTTGFALVGGLIGRHYGGKVGAAVGGTIGGACGLGVVAVTMRSIWQEIKAKLADLFDLVYDYLAGLGLDDYMGAAMVLMAHDNKILLATLILDTISSTLGKEILSTITAASKNMIM